jgi:hypothetical protein
MMILKKELLVSFQDSSKHWKDETICFCDVSWIGVCRGETGSRVEDQGETGSRVEDQETFSREITG